MGIPLEKIMKIPPFSNAVLVGGKKGIGRIVESANIQEVPHVERWLHGGEIVFSSGYTFGSTEAACDLLKRLNKFNATALAIKPGQYLECIPDAMIKCADELNFPLFEMPEDLPYMDCIIPIFEYLMDEHIFYIHHVENVHNLLMQSMIQNEGLDGLCKMLYQVIHKPVFIFSEKGVSLASCVGEAAQPGYKNMIEDEFKGYCIYHKLWRLKKNKCNKISVGLNRGLICVPVYIQRDHVANLILDLLEEMILDVDLLAFENASPLIAIELLQEKALIQKEQNIRGQLLEDIIMKKYGDENVIIKRGLHVGFDVTQSFCAFEIDADSFEDYVNTELKNFDEAEIQKIKLDIQECFWCELQKVPEKILLMNKSVGVIGLVSIHNPDQIIECKKMIRSVMKEQKKTHPKLTFSAGIGKIKDQFSDAGESLKEAKLALNTIREQHTYNQGTIACFDDLGCLCFLNELSGSVAMKKFYQDNMQNILDYDDKNEGELVKTLECYFQCGGNIRLTSEKMFVHKNSIVYRIRKIESLIDGKISDPETEFNLQICLKIKNMI